MNTGFLDPSRSSICHSLFLDRFPVALINAGDVAAIRIDY
jgi:ethanolamine utilization microcompartment shell protein EutS